MFAEPLYVDTSLVGKKSGSALVISSLYKLHIFVGQRISSFLKIIPNELSIKFKGFKWFEKKALQQIYFKAFF